MTARLPTEPLVSTRWLAEHLEDADLRVFDCTVHLIPGESGLRIQSGRQDYEEGHIPGAGFLDPVSQLSDASSALAFTRPSAARVEEVLSRSGASSEHRVVVYSGSSVMWATRVWWLLRAAGHEWASVLDGGVGQWTAEGRPLTTRPCEYSPTTFKCDPREELWATREEVLRKIDDRASCTINALPRAIHSGQSGLGYARPGHISGSVNIPFPDLVDPDTGAFRPLAELRRHFEAVGALERARVITYCGGGVAATLNAFALTLVGHPNVAVYDGSLAEWAGDPSLPMNVGE